MGDNRKNLTILAIFIGIIWLVLLYTQIHLTERVFYSYRQVFQNKLDIAVKQSLRELDKAVFDRYFEEDNWHEKIMQYQKSHPYIDSQFSSLPVSESTKAQLSAFIGYLTMSQSNFNYHSVGIGLLDSLVSVSLHDNFIYDPCEIGLYCFEHGVVHHLSDDVDEQMLLQYGFRYNLYCVTSDGVLGTDILYLYFPELQSRFRWDIVIAFVVIILLLLILLYCFLYFITIVIRQRKISELRTNMVHNITHELKTPITTINLATQLLRDESVQKDQNAYRDYLNIISEESDSLLNLVDEVLTVFRTERIPFKEMKELSIHPLIEEVISNHQLQLNQCNAVVNLDLKAENDVVLGNHDHLLNGLSNLLDNAIKYRNGDLVIDVSTRNVDNTIEISFKDNGIGIDKANLSLIFEPFARVNTSNEHYVKGYGLGLNYLSQIVKYHKGTIKVESELQKGTTFFVSLPLAIK